MHPAQIARTEHTLLAVRAVQNAVDADQAVLDEFAARLITVERCQDDGMWSPAPVPPIPSAINLVVEILDPVLTPLGFAPGQGGASERQGQVIFCSADDGCVDLVVDLEATPDWRITDVRYWGFPSDRWHLDFDEHADLADQLRHLAQSLPIDLA